MNACIKAVRLLGLAVTATGIGWTASHADPLPPQPEFVVAYAEAPATRIDTVVTAMRRYAATRPDAAATRPIEVLQEIGRPQRMAVIEHVVGGQVPAAEDLVRTLDGMVQAPLDWRPNRMAGVPIGRAVSGGFHMLMHVDVVPAGAPLAAQALDSQRKGVLSAPGGLGFELAIQLDRSNHFAVHEIWTNRAAYEAYAATAAAKDLRRQLATVKGALFDDRFFRPVPSHASPRSGKSK